MVLGTVGRDRKLHVYMRKQILLGCTYTNTLLMMIVDYTNDPYSEDDPINAICSRGDLMKEPEAGGCYDTKVYTPLHTS